MRSKRRTTKRSARRTTPRRTTKRSARKTTPRRTTKRSTRRTTNRRSLIKTREKQIPKFYIMTYKENIPFAKQAKKTLKKEWGITGDIIKGYKIGDKYNQKPLKKNEVVMAGFKEKLLPIMKDSSYYLEDDIRFTSEPLKHLNKDIVWSVYRRGKLTNKPPHNIITGIQAIYLSKKAITRLKEYIQTKKLQHFDSFMSKFINDNKDLSFKQVTPKIGYEEDHDSLISKAKDWKKYTRKSK